MYGPFYSPYIGYALGSGLLLYYRQTQNVYTFSQRAKRAHRLTCNMQLKIQVCILDIYLYMEIYVSIYVYFCTCALLRCDRYALALGLAQPRKGTPHASHAAGAIGEAPWRGSSATGAARARRGGTHMAVGNPGKLIQGVLSIHLYMHTYKHVHVCTCMYI